jgi:hypothetical protein
MASIIGKHFLFVRAYRTDMLSWHHILIMHKEKKLRRFNSTKSYDQKNRSKSIVKPT